MRVQTMEIHTEMGKKQGNYIGTMGRISEGTMLWMGGITGELDRSWRCEASSKKKGYRTAEILSQGSSKIMGGQYDSGKTEKRIDRNVNQRTNREVKLANQRIKRERKYKPHGGQHTLGTSRGSDKFKSVGKKWGGRQGKPHEFYASV